MATRYSTRRLVTVVLLSQAMVIQTLLLSWGGAVAVAGELAGGFGIICSGVSESRGADGSELPAKPDAHRDCLDACLTCHAVATLPDEASLPSRMVAYASVSIPTKMPLLEISGTRAFLPRGPPTLA